MSGNRRVFINLCNCLVIPPRGAHASATCYSLIETAKANGIEPAQYIYYVLKHIADADTLEKLEALLP